MKLRNSNSRNNLLIGKQNKNKYCIQSSIYGKKFLFYQILLFTFGSLLSSCGVYSFSGTSTSASSIFVGNFLNRASNGPANLGINFTEKLKDYYQRNTKLDIVAKDGELNVTGNIIRYEMTPIAPTSEATAAQNRLTIAVEVDFVDAKDEKKNFKQTFSFYSDFPQNQALAQVENTKIDEIFEQIILDVFNKTVADW